MLVTNVYTKYVGDIFRTNFCTYDRLITSKRLFGQFPDTNPDLNSDWLIHITRYGF